MREWAADIPAILNFIVSEEKLNPVRNRERMSGLGIPDEGIPDQYLRNMIHDIAKVSPATGSKRFFNQLFGGRNAPAVFGEVVAAGLHPAKNRRQNDATDETEASKMICTTVDV